MKHDRHDFRIRIVPTEVGRSARITRPVRSRPADSRLLRVIGIVCCLLAYVDYGETNAVAYGNEKTNVLFIAVDDMNADLACYGHSQVKSPHIDSLARAGVRFAHAYCQLPLCSPSRTSLMTGLRPDTTQVFDLRKHFRSVIPDVVTLSELFKQHGYFAARVGKIYHYGNPGDIGTNGLDDPQSWHEVVNPKGRDKTEEHLIVNYTPKRGLGSSLSVLAAEGTDLEQTDGMVASETIRLMEEHRDEPFFLAAGFYRPHCPYVAPKKYFELYPFEDIRMPHYPAEHLQDIPPLALTSTRPRPWFGVTEEQARKSKQAYYACISFVDAQIGRLLESLDRLQLREKTLIVFWSDHGYHLGEHGLWKKQSNFEESARAPLIFAGAGVKATSHTYTAPVEFVDIYPTVADMCGLELPKHLQGVSLKPILQDRNFVRDRPAFTQVQRGRVPGHSVRTSRWRYIEWGNGKQGLQLYDHANDPLEIKNLASDPQHADVVAQLQKLVRANWPADSYSNHIPQRRRRARNRPIPKDEVRQK